MKKLLTMIAALGVIGAYAIPTYAQPNKPSKMDVCHVTGNGSYHMINVSERAWPAHEAHGDALPGDEVPEMEGYTFTDTCEMEEVQPELSTTEFQVWPIYTDEFGTLIWQAEGRYGSNTAVGDWELGVGNDTHVVGQFDQAQHVWGDSPVTENFTVDYDADTGLATFTVDGDSTDYTVGTDTAGNLYLVARASSGADDYVTLSNLMLDGSALGTDLTANSGAVESLQILGADLNSDWTLTGTVEMVYTTTSGSAPAFQLQVSSGI